MSYTKRKKRLSSTKGIERKSRLQLEADSVVKLGHDIGGVEDQAVLVTYDDIEVGGRCNKRRSEDEGRSKDHLGCKKR
jgi:hypothetical protein